MIPTLLLAGLVLGRWWAVPLAAVAWTGVLAWTVGLDTPAGATAAAGLAAANTAVGVAVHRLLRAVSRSRSSR